MFFLSPGLIIPEWTPLSQITAIRSSIPFTPLGICRKMVENTFTFSEVLFLHWTTFFGSAEHFHFLKYYILSAKPLWSRWYQGLSVLRWTCSCLYQCTDHENNCKAFKVLLIDFGMINPDIWSNLCFPPEGFHLKGAPWGTWECLGPP